jgi:hypothetical protein
VYRISIWNLHKNHIYLTFICYIQSLFIRFFNKYDRLHTVFKIFYQTLETILLNYQKELLLIFFQKLIYHILFCVHIVTMQFIQLSIENKKGGQYYAPLHWRHKFTVTEISHYKLSSPSFLLILVVQNCFKVAGHNVYIFFIPCTNVEGIHEFQLDFHENQGAGIAQSVKRLTTGWTTRGAGFRVPIG